MFTYSKVSGEPKDGLPVGNIYFGRFSKEEKIAFLAGRLVISKGVSCEEDHYAFRRFGGTCDACSKTF